MQERGLDLSKHGWIPVHEHLQSLSHPHIFVAGDCCTIEGLTHGSPPKAGVYAVQSGPILIKNLTRFLSDKKPQQPLQAFHPQDDFLKLIVCGDGIALSF
jgi:selenide,water dikinase